MYLWLPPPRGDMSACCATYSYSSLRVAPGHEGVVESELSRVLPSKLAAAGHRFRQPDLDQALRHVLGRTR